MDQYSESYVAELLSAFMQLDALALDALHDGDHERFDRCQQNKARYADGAMHQLLGYFGEEFGLRQREDIPVQF
jgi:hypothetical protein